MDHLFFLGRISICFILGVVIGLERQYRRKIAGIRTVTLVSLGAFLFVSISQMTAPSDVTRIAAQVVSGIGFLGAGVILRDGPNIRGLNTAATLWCGAAVGTLTALGLIIEAIIGVVYILLSNLFLRFISKKIMKRIKQKTEHYSLTIKCDADKEMSIKNLLVLKIRTQENVIKNFNTSKDDDCIKIEAQLEIINDGVDSVDSIVDRLCIEPGVKSTEYNKITNHTSLGLNLLFLS